MFCPNCGIQIRGKSDCSVQNGRIRCLNCDYDMTDYMEQVAAAGHKKKVQSI